MTEVSLVGLEQCLHVTVEGERGGESRRIPFCSIAAISFGKSPWPRVEIEIDSGRLVGFRATREDYDRITAAWHNRSEPEESADESDDEPETSLDRYRAETDRLTAYGVAISGLAETLYGQDRYLDNECHDLVRDMIYNVAETIGSIAENDNGPPVPDSDDEE